MTYICIIIHGFRVKIGSTNRKNARFDNFLRKKQVLTMRSMKYVLPFLREASEPPMSFYKSVVIPFVNSNQLSAILES